MKKILLQHKPIHNNENGHADIFKGSLQIGSISFGTKLAAENQQVNVVDLPVFKAFGLEEEPAMIIGNDMNM